MNRHAIDNWVAMDTPKRNTRGAARRVNDNMRYVSITPITRCGTWTRWEEEASISIFSFRDRALQDHARCFSGSLT